MDPRVAEGALIAVPIAAWFGLYGVARLVTRPRVPSATPATQELGPEPPAVVSLLVNHWEVTEDAAESTLLDLAARKILEFRQPSNDPRQTTVHVRQPNPVGLNAYEQRVFNRVSGLAAGGVVPLTALTFREPGPAKAWGKRLAAEVIAEARTKGLSRRRFGPAVLAMLGVAAAIAGVCVSAGALVYLHQSHSHSHDTGKDVLGAGFFTFVALSAIAGKAGGERDTPGGRAVAARWLGVRGWLRGHEAFGDQPPAAVAIWDRYLSYGAALGATRVASAVIDLGMGNRKRVWSSYGGPNGPAAWHRVRVHYPRFWSRYGRSAPRLILRGLIAAALGVALVKFWYGAVDMLSSVRSPSSDSIASSFDLIKGLGLLAGVALALLGMYMIGRTVIDLVSPAEITGEVIWTEHWRAGQNNQPAIYYLAVDDATGDHTKAWALPATLRSQCGDTDIVTIRVRRWSRRVIDVTLVQRGAESKLSGAEASMVGLDGEDLVRQALGLPAQRQARGGGRLQGLIAGLVTPLTPLGPPATAEEVAAALGVAVTPRSRTGQEGSTPMEITEYAGPDGKPALTVMRGAGALAMMMLRKQAHGEQVAGLGDEAYGGPGWLTVRRGEEVLALRLGQAYAGVPPMRFLSLAQTCVSRLPAPSPGE